MAACFRGSRDSDRAPTAQLSAPGYASAYPVFNSQCLGKRFYFVQDFEPLFYPASSASILAENTYRMGFHAITAGRWLAEKLSLEFEMEADYFEFGCDKSCYGLLSAGNRNGIAYYARRGSARRGFELGTMAIEMFAKRNPGVEIHFYGEKIGRLPFHFVDHGLTSPQELNRIYNRCFAGLCLSLTNVSLVPHEMLAAGCIPVVNDAIHNRVVLDNDYVRYAPPTPRALCEALEDLATDPTSIRYPAPPPGVCSRRRGKPRERESMRSFAEWSCGQLWPCKSR